MVHLLTRSSVARYVEFKAVDKLFTHNDGKTEQVWMGGGCMEEREGRGGEGSMHVVATPVK